MPDLSPFISYFIAAAVVLGLLILLAVLARSLTGRAALRRGARLGVVEALDVDKMRRLVLVRRDDVEHLIMIGGEQELLIETGIGLSRARAAAAEPMLRERPSAARVVFDEADGFDDLPPEPAPVEPLEPRIRPAVQPAQPALRPAPRPAVFGDRLERSPNLRAVERDEPGLGTVRPVPDRDDP